MSLRKITAPQAFRAERPEGLTFDPPSEALARWAELGTPQAAEADEPNTISIYEEIGSDFWTGEGVTAKRIAAALRKIGANPVTVNINSPGGDFFEGLAIFNLLVEHPARVDIKVMGLAASAASVIAMAGDTVTMGLGAFLMIHNAWALAIGNRHDMRAAADFLEPFDVAMAEVYAARAGDRLDQAGAAALMDAETWLSASEAVAKGLADETMTLPERDDAGGDDKTEARAGANPKHRLDAILARAGVPRSERRHLLRAITAGTHDAAGGAMPRAGEDIMAGIDRLIATLKS